MPRPDLTGRKFGRWVVLYRDGSDRKGQRLWMCRCDCGTERRVRGIKLLTGEAFACGCYGAEQTSKRSTIHGERNLRNTTAEYKSWKSAKARVSNPKIDGYEHYGGRGIKMCDRWLESYPNFVNDMGRKPTLKHTLERKDVNGDYEPSNCIWATMVEQNNNRRDTKRITRDGRSMTVTQWCRELGMNPKTVLLRLFYGWNVERALTVPIQIKERKNATPSL